MAAAACEKVLPSDVVARRWLLLAGCGIWGTVTVAMAFISSWPAMMVLRGTADGSKVVEFEQAAKELVGLQEREEAAADEVASAEADKTKAEEAQQQVEQELRQRQQEIEQLRQQTGTPAGSRGKKRAR